MTDVISIRISPGRRAMLDALARATDSSRGRVINAAIDAWLDIHDWHTAHIEAGLRQANTGEFATDAEVAAVFRA